MTKTIAKTLSDGTFVEFIDNIPYVEVLEVGTDPHGFWTYAKKVIKEIDGKSYAFEWEYDRWLKLKQQEKDSLGFYMTLDQIYIEGITT